MDVRIVAATNADLVARMDAGRFRRELENEVRRLVSLAADGQVLDSGLLAPTILDTPAPPSELPAGADTLNLASRVRALEAELIREALRRAGGKPTHMPRGSSVRPAMGWRRR